jgi:hypothetical protein
MTVDHFGFLRSESELRFEGGLIEPQLSDGELQGYLDRLVNHDGFIYPPETVRMNLDPKTLKPLREIPGTRRSALLYRLPATHRLSLSSVQSVDELRAGAGGFIMHLLAYVFGTRLQFHDWWFDGRVPVSVRHVHTISISRETIEDLLCHAYAAFSQWKPDQQHLFTNLLYMHSRVPSYEWDWEQFTVEYMVFDACWRFAMLRYKLKAQRHRDRVYRLCERFNVPVDEQCIQTILELRKQLFHEALWDGSSPGTPPRGDATLSHHNLRRLNQRLIPALLGYRTSYVEKRWWCMGVCVFDKREQGRSPDSYSP